MGKLTQGREDLPDPAESFPLLRPNREFPEPNREIPETKGNSPRGITKKAQEHRHSRIYGSAGAFARLGLWEPPPKRIATP